MEPVPRPAPDQPHDTAADLLRRVRSDPRVVFAILVCVALAAGVAWFRAGLAPNAPASATTGTRSTTSASSGSSGSPDTTAADAATTSTTSAAVVVDVVGAVQRPGIVTLRAGARVVDAISAAGGAAPSADLGRLNLAAPIADGSRIAVPATGQQAPALDPAAVTSGGAGNDAAGASAAGATDAAPINVNTATADELDALPGVGPATADAIVREREAHGPFASVDDLERVKGIGPSKVAALRDRATV